MKKKHQLYLNKTVVALMLAAYGSIVILILIMDIYQIINYQLEQRRTEQTILTGYVAEVKAEMKSIESKLYDIYANDANFQLLTNPKEGEDQFTKAYDIYLAIRGKVNFEDDFDGAYLYYDNYEEVYYYADVNTIDVADTRYINNLLLKYVPNATNREWFITKGEKGLYLVNIYKKKNVAVCGVKSLAGIEKYLTDMSNKSVEVLIYGNDGILSSTIDENELSLRAEIKDKSNDFMTKKNDYRIYGAELPSVNTWICTAYKGNILNYVNLQFVGLSILTIIAVLAMIFLFVYVNKHVVMPLNDLTKLMDTIKEGGEIEEEKITYRFYELENARETLIEMVSELKNQKILTYEEKVEKQRTQMKYLQMQLKPHFYLNNLKTLNALIYEGKTEKAEELILQLSSHLRYLLGSERASVSIEEELAFVENYLKMQQFVSGRRVEYSVECTEEAKPVHVPMLIIQTFVENSIKYARTGLADTSLFIRIMIDLIHDENNLYLNICVHDNGIGYSDEALSRISNEEMSVNIGINNLKRRCGLFYGDKAEFSFFNDEGARSEVLINIGGSNESIDS